MELSLQLLSGMSYSSPFPLNRNQNNLLLFQTTAKRWWNPSRRLSPSDYFAIKPAKKLLRRANNAILCSKEAKEKIKQMFTKVQVSVSSYDTAWVAMVPSPNSPKVPRYPQCLEWLLENQLQDGSWALPCRHPLLIKDALSSTLACILALKRWNIGAANIERGLEFIGSKFASAVAERQHSPFAFDLIFSGMLETAMDMGVNFRLSTAVLDTILENRDLELKRGPKSNSKGREAYLAYASEGLGNSQKWENVMKYQRRNGLLFDSPATTAAALLHCHDSNYSGYSNSCLEKFGNTVPTTYPLDVYASLSLVDNLERLGIDRHFSNEIRDVMENTYRCWLHMDEEIFLETKTCALAFRMLRMHGYDISSDAFLQFDEASFSYTLDGCLEDLNTILELYKASEIMIYQDESSLQKLNLWSSRYLKQVRLQVLTDADGLHKHIIQEVDYALKFPYYASLDRLATRRNIEHYDTEKFSKQKTCYRFVNINYSDLLELAVEDFGFCQTIHRIELEQLQRWVEENRLDELTFVRQKLLYCYFAVAASLFSPELADARISFAKTSVLSTVIDDFFDVEGSLEELVNLVTLAENWSKISPMESYSEHVKIIFSALYDTVNEMGDKASEIQGRNVSSHLTETWLSFLRCMLKETEQTRNNSVLKMEEYMQTAPETVGLGVIITPTLYFIGVPLSDETVRSEEYQNLMKHVFTCARLLNDIQGFERERKEGKLNAVTLTVIQPGGADTIEEAITEIWGVIDSSRRELQRLVLQTKDSVVPKACKDVFWKVSKICHAFYRRTDGYTCPEEMIRAVNAVLHEPLTSRFNSSSESK